MDQIEISGVVDSVIFSNAETGFAILELERDGTGEPVVVTGTIPYASEGDSLKVWGKWVIHPVYGEQLKATSYEKSLPAERGQILRYLASGAVKGIGPKTALKIVDKYGESSFEVIENHSDWLAEIPGISRKKAAEVSRAFREASGARSVLIRFKDYLSDAASMKIYKRWGSSAIDRVKENPYILCEEIRGVGFAKADAVAMSFGIAKDSPFRISGGIVSYLQSAGAKEGHTCLKLEELKAGCAEMLGVDPETVHDIIVEMLVAARLRVVSKNNEKYIYLPSLFNAEKYIASKLVSLATRCETYDEVDAERMIMKLERTNDIVYDALQREAISDTLKSGVMILTGGPGTGKTTVIKAIISIFRSLGMEIALAAPTGRAAKRMSEATSFEAKTIHRLLCMEFSGENENGKFLKDEHDRLDEDLIIIDESSMVDVLLMEALLKAVKPGARL
ncbi:MAG: AAA family ATPase, partial [Sphaerochaetaceae bacterium]|nr:AAA family ATPase [Sphaerochaetaceae bacterium]